MDVTGDHRREFLAACRPFTGLPNELLEALLTRMVEATYERGERLIRQADPGDSLQLLLEGRAAVVVVSDAEDPTEVAEVEAGDVVGEMALISGEPTSADVVARSPVKVLKLPANDFHDLARRHPEIAVVLTRLIADRLGRDSADALGGKLVRGYRIVRCLGRGGMAVVYEANAKDGGGRVALKMMSHRLTYDTTALARFREETQLLESFDHENIARLLDKFSAYGTHFVVLEFCDGPGLDAATRRKVPFPEELVRPVIGQIARTLNYVHRLGFLHRDIKPSNVMLTMDGHAKLIDFGVARPIEQHDERTQTLETSVVGTPFYMAPEQFEGTNEIDQTVDSYALACVAYELLTGERAFKKSTTFKMMQQKMTLQMPPAEGIGLGISAEMHDFLVRNLDPEPTRRDRSLVEAAGWAAPIAVDRLLGDDQPV